MGGRSAQKAELYYNNNFFVKFLPRLRVICVLTPGSQIVRFRLCFILTECYTSVVRLERDSNKGRKNERTARKEGCRNKKCEKESYIFFLGGGESLRKFPRFVGDSGHLNVLNALPFEVTMDDLIEQQVILSHRI